ncbi:MAG: M48 family metallopeptidase [Anaeromyxobacteraceae bacterium]
MSRLRALALLAVPALFTPGCARLLRDVPGGQLLGERLDQDAKVVGGNLLGMVASGEITKTAAFDMEQEHYLGKTVAASVIARIDGAALPPEHPVSAYLREVGTLVAVTAAEDRAEDDRPYPLKGYRFIPVVSAQQNAVGSPGGFVVVTTGLLRAVRSEDELAAILAHEVAHVQRGHTLQPIEAARRQEHLSEGLLKGTDSVVHAFFGKAVQAGTDFVLDRGFGKKNELAADAFAAKILDAAGYDPSALSGYLGRLSGKSASGGFFSRHPPAAERAKALSGAASRPAPAVRTARFVRAMAALP